MKFVQLIFFVFLIFVLSKCDNIFAPGITDGDPNAKNIINDQKTPEEVLENFTYAYNFKDSLVYADLLDSNFVFYFSNFDTDPVTQDSWGRDVDIKTTLKMFRHFETINLVWGAQTESTFTDENKKRIGRKYNLTFDGGISISTLQGEAIFTIKKQTVSASDTTTIWRIIEWVDRS